MFVQLLVGIVVPGVDLSVIFFQKQGQTAAVLLALHDKNKADVHQVVGRIAQIVQHLVDIGILVRHRVAVLIQPDLLDLPGIKVKNHRGRMGTENDLIFPR